MLKAMHNFIRSWGRARVIGLGLVATVTAAVAVAPAASSARTASAKSKGKHLSIAYLSFAVQNSYDAPMLAAAKKVAAANNASLTVFDANNSPTTQFSQFQDVIAKGGYQGIITQPIEATNLIPLVNQAVAKHIKVVNIDQVMGPSLVPPRCRSRDCRATSRSCRQDGARPRDADRQGLQGGPLQPVQRRLPV